jgi:DNA-binding LacI/PurR family transcriptional regulator
MSDIVKESGRATIYDVARAAGVSKSLVSLVLQGDDRVSDTRRQAVLQAIEKLGYRPSRAAKLLAGNSSKSIGVVIDDYSNLWFVGILAGLRKVFDAAGFQTTVSDLHRLESSTEDPIDNFQALHMDGIVVATEPDSLRERSYDFPAVLVGDREREIENVDHVTSDDTLGGYMATKHLINSGHKHIGHITGLGGTAAKRRIGYEKAMKESGLDLLIVGSGLATDERTGFEGAKTLLAMSPSLTAIFAANDYMAAGAFSHLRNAGKLVPADISLIGHDNSPAASEYNLNLTTVAYDDDAIGTSAANLLLARIENPKVPPQRIVIDPIFIKRGSTRRI